MLYFEGSKKGPRTIPALRLVHYQDYVQTGGPILTVLTQFMEHYGVNTPEAQKARWKLEHGKRAKENVH